MSKTLLLADDSVTIQKVVGISFANEDVRIVTVDNGDDAVTRAHEIQPDIVLADVVMPGKSGYDVCAAIKADPKLSGVPVLLLTGTFETFDEDRAAQVGADGHITKPFEAQALVELVNARLSGAPAVAEPAAPAASERGTAPAAEPEPFDFLEPEQNTLPRPRSGSGQRLAAAPEEDPFGFDAEPLDAPDLDAGPEDLDEIGNDATEARTTLLIEEPGPEAPEAVAETARPVEAPPSPVEDEELTRLVLPDAGSPPDAEPAAEADPLDDVFDPVLGDEADAPAASADYDVASPEDEDGFRTRVIEDVAAADADEGLAEPIFEDELSDAAALDLPPPGAEVQPAEAAAAASESGVELSAALQEQVHETLEKIAWEAFGDLSERIVREAVERIEQVAWDVMPRLAETLIREEIRKLKGEE